ncbi:MAG: tyrosine recombinase XerC [Ruminococcaceae bacterium]|nr:tyrosine recombinase XerC [Oscillospiraceae bacterium]
MSAASTPLPFYAEDFLVYLEAIAGKSQNTIKEYRYDLLMFFRFICKRKFVDKPENFTIEMFDKIVLTDLYAFLNYTNRERGDKAVTRARKVACLRSFFKYLFSKAHLISTNPAQELDSPKITKTLPRYLELDDCHKLLNVIDGEFKERDYCIIILFLNCGMRLSELVGINISDISGDTLIVTGKGNKERTIYLNDSCIDAIKNYLLVRPKTEDIGEYALFLSKRRQRISTKTVQYTVKKYIKLAGLDSKKYSTHKLRHTAATLMYSHGDVDIRALQEILGHSSVATTEIYTHVNNARIKEAVSKNPLANFKPDQHKNEE